MVKMKFVKVVTVAVAIAVVAVGCSSGKKKKRASQSLQITTTALPDATEGVSYSATIEATGGTTPYTWSVSPLPSGLTWSRVGDTVQISGTPPIGSAGTYTLTVEVTDGQRTASKQFDLVVKPALEADFEANPTEGKAPLTVTFTDKSTGNPTSWEWDFDGDGTVDSTDQNPQWTYNDPGWYTVKLTVSDGTNSDTCVKEMFVLVADDIYYVDGVNGDDANGGADWSDAFATIGKALSVADDYDLVLVADATYNETDLNFSGKKIYLKGVDHNTAGARPVIDCQQADRAFTFNSSETKESVIDNLTIKNGKVVDDKGGAVVCENGSSPTIINCIFESNIVDDSNSSWGDFGGAVFCDESSPTIMNCTFANNYAYHYGGAIHCSGGNCAATIINCVFDGNSAYQGGAFSCAGASPQICNCTFCSNSSVGGGAGGAIFVISSGSVTINNSILWGNIGPIHEVNVYDNSSSCTLKNCCIDASGSYSYAPSASCIVEDGCIYDDPLFVDDINGDYHLRDASPCIDAGDNSLVPSGVDKELDGNPRIVNGTVDIGAYEYQSSVQSLQITTTALPSATEGASYSATLTATGGTTPYTWTVSGLPSGLTWSQVGDTVQISGTPASGTAGTYNVDVTVNDSSSPTRSVSATLQLVVNQAGGGTTLKADFEANPTYGKAPLTVNFTDKSTGNPTSWEWDFDNDGTPDSTEQNPQWTYNNPGWYTVKLTISDGTSTHTCVKEKYIVVASGIYYVDGMNGDDANGGTDWSDAFATIGKALSVAGDYDLVLVADATYNETDLNLDGKKIYLKGVDHNTVGARPVIDCQQAGRAFYFDSGETEDSVIDNFTIQSGKVSSDAGGAIYCANSSGPTIRDCIFNGSSAGWGGAIYCDSSSPTITDCTFSGNSADDAGGAIFCVNFSGPTVTNCTFSGNSAVTAGGAIFCVNLSDLTVTNCTFSGNSADSAGGAIYCDSSRPVLNNCVFSGNSVTTYDGGAIYCVNSSGAAVVNSTFSGNKANRYGGAAACVYYSRLTVANCTLSGNSVNDSGGAIFCANFSSAILRNSILWGDSASSGGNEIYIYDLGSSCTLNYCCVDNTGYAFGGGSTIDDSNNCIFVEPQFVDAAGGDYHLQDTSPCIDAGDNGLVPSSVDKDLDGNERIVDGDNDGVGTVDIGAYEKQ